MTATRLFSIFLLLLWLSPRARADVAVLVGEPYSYDGALAGTGHSAVYLTRVCAASPTVLRRCEAGEPGVVISRYNAVGGYDWIAIPLIPYLYAVERPENIPLFVDPKIVASLRDHYRRTHLEAIVPDGPSGESPAGNWYELVGSAYDRTLYGFQLETTEAEDDKFIAQYNARSNREAYKFVTRNCADFVREVVNFYYPKAVGRSWVADFGVTTPKHAAKSLVKYAKRHNELHFSSFIVSQVPGTAKRSTPIRGGVESVFKAKKYELPLLAFQPFVAGGFALAYEARGRFDPAKGAVVLEPDGNLQQPLTADARRSYEKGLDELLRSAPDSASANARASWRAFSANAKVLHSESGAPVLSGELGDSPVEIGIARSNVLSTSASAELTRYLLIARLKEELQSKSAAKVSEARIRADWKLLQAVLPSGSPNLVVSTDGEKRVSPGGAQ